jgi:hypothetical protein
MADNQPVVSSLLMDRSSPLGNSDDVFGRQALHVKIGNKSNEPVPVYISDGGTSGSPFYLSTQGSTTPGVSQTILSDTNSGTVPRHISAIYVICRIEGQALIKIDGTLIGSVRTGAAVPNARFSYDVPRAYSPGSILTVEFKSRAGSPISDVECHAIGLDHN